MDSYPQQAGPWVIVAPLLVAALVILRNSRARDLKIERLWIAPTLLLAVTVMAFWRQHMPGPLMLAVDLASLGVGAALGWWRGRLTNITVNPETHALTSKASPVGMLLILGIFAIRFGLRSYLGQAATALHVSVIDVTDAFLLLAVGLVCAQRLELALRANRLLAEARGRTA